jgi:glycosyltransferase involved in cell wall biosynthesis
MNNKVKIGIGIPIRNGEKYLQETIESTLSQIEPADEIVVVINNSRDKSLQICENFLPHIRIVEDDSIDSIGAAWNAVYQYSKCDYVVMLHQDDLLESNTIKVLKNKIISDPACELIFGRMKIISSKGSLLRVNFTTKEVCLTGDNYIRQVISGFLPGCSGMCAKRKLILKNPYRTDLQIVLDIEFFIRIGWEAKVIGIPDILSSYRLHNDSTLHSDNNRKSQKDLIRWWQLIESQQIYIPEHLLLIYQAGLLKRTITAFLQDLQRNDHLHTFEWIDFLQQILNEYPHLYNQSFTVKSRLIYELTKIPKIGYAIAYQILQLRQKLILIFVGTKN